MSTPTSTAEMLSAAQSLLWVLADRRRYAAMQRAIDVPVLLLHGDRTGWCTSPRPVRLPRPTRAWRFEVARGVGHVPQLEVPEWTARARAELAGRAPGRGGRRGPGSAAPATGGVSTWSG